MPLPFSTLEYPTYKWVILALLTLNAVIYAIIDTVTSAVDALTWLLLLVIYELQTHNDARPLPEQALTQVRTVLIGLIVFVFFSYLSDSEWLDVINAVLWFALIAIMEAEVRWPRFVLSHAGAFWLMTIGVFIGLIAMSGLWLWQRNWLDAYDALLWIIAFGSIEADIVQLLQRKDIAQPEAKPPGMQ